MPRWQPGLIFVEFRLTIRPEMVDLETELQALARQLARDLYSVIRVAALEAVGQALARAAEPQQSLVEIPAEPEGTR